MQVVSWNKYTTLVGDLDNVRVGAENMKKISVPSTQFCYEPKTALKIKIYFFKVYARVPPKYSDLNKANVNSKEKKSNPTQTSLHPHIVGQKIKHKEKGSKMGREKFDNLQQNGNKTKNKKGVMEAN